ncbi:MAG: heme o synthase [Anaerolineaceae bacterium]|nr:heme o synthase [Anaerolineaceae bacterium]
MGGDLSLVERQHSPRLDLTFRLLVLSAALAVFILIVFGSIVRVTGSSQACPDWPTCYGQLALPDGPAARWQMIHRALAGVAGLLMLAAAGMAAWLQRKNAWISRPLYLALGMFVLETFLGSSVALPTQAAWQAPLHLIMGVTMLALLVTSSTLAFYQESRRDKAIRLRWRSRFSQLTLFSLVAILLLMASGVWVVASGAGQLCSGWPLCNGGLPTDQLGWLQMGHRFLTLLAGVLMTAQILLAWRSQRSQTVVLPAAMTVFTLFVSQAMLGGVKVLRGFPEDLVVLHSVSAVALFASQVILVVATGMAARTTADEREEAAEERSLRRRLYDFFLLSKPIIVLLLLVTTYAGMVVGAKQIPGLGVTLWTLLGGALAAGGSSALNQYIDRDVDGAMQRTAKRPLPAGRLKAAEGLAFGIGANVLGFFLLAGFVNLLSALLALAGSIYYVLLYSIWLKRLTVQNIVIGGGAGAIPPLVGWAAATGSLNIPSLFLFAIVFMWTPPHFWALALVRRKDYARAGIPMLPVVRGEQATRLQILIYTLELVGVTLLMPLFKITGSVFLVSALVLGAWLIYTAWRVFKVGGNKTAWLMYRYSSMYLAFLFFALVVDVLV